MYNKYRINSEFEPVCQQFKFLNQATFAVFEAMNRNFRELWGKNQTDGLVKITKTAINSYDGTAIPIQIVEPLYLPDQAPCLILYHAGAYLITGMEYHIRLTRDYALKAGCKVIYIDYRLLPLHAFPTALYDAYSLLQWVYNQSGRLGIDPQRIVLYGDSAGGNLTAGVSLLARDRQGPAIAGQMMIYPIIDARQNTRSMKAFSDTPVWNSQLNAMMWSILFKNGEFNMRHYVSVAETKSLVSLPPAYIETAEFDCLRDEGIAYANLLSKAGNTVTLNNTKGTMHCYDMAEHSPIVKDSIQKRLDFMNSCFRN